MLRHGLVAAAAVCLWGCASLHESLVPLRGEDAFEASGRVAVRAGKEGSTGRFSWRHDALSDELLITSPFGQGVARINRRDGRVLLVTADSKEYVAPDAESLTEKVLGWRLPLAGLPDWIRGRVSAARPAETRRDERGRVVELAQDDWRVEFQEFEGALPSRIRLARGDLEIRLVIERWTHAGPDTSRVDAK